MANTKRELLIYRRYLRILAGRLRKNHGAEQKVPSPHRSVHELFAKPK